MELEKLKSLRKFVKSFKNIDKILGQHKAGMNVSGHSVDELEALSRQFEAAFTGKAPVFSKHKYFSHESGRERYYVLDGIRAHLGSLLGGLEIEIEDEESLPVTEVRDFSFVSNKPLQAIIERDYGEIQRNFVTKSWKSAIILAGGIIEALLLDLLEMNVKVAKSSAIAPNKDLSRWDLNDLIKVAVQEKLVNDGIDKLSHSVREYRNLVHPAVEIREKLSCEEEEAKIAINVLHMVQRELAKATS